MKQQLEDYRNQDRQGYILLFTEVSHHNGHVIHFYYFGHMILTS